MSILKSILSPFVEFKEKETAAKETASPATETEKGTYNPDKTASIATTTPTSYTSSSGAATTQALPEFKKYFDNLVDEANAKNPLFQGTDFKEFIDSKIDVEAIADEESRYKTAFNVLKRTGLTKERLLTTGSEYITIINNDIKAFENAYNQQYKTDVEQKEQLLQKKAEELQALSERIAALNEETKRLSQEVLQSKEKLNVNKAAFLSAGENKKKEIQTELQKIEQYFSS